MRKMLIYATVITAFIVANIAGAAAMLIGGELLLATGAAQWRITWIAVGMTGVAVSITILRWILDGPSR